MITPAILDEIAERRTKGHRVPEWQIDAMVTMLRSHPAIAVGLLGPSEAKPAVSSCSFPSCHCVQACAAYVRARG